MNTEQMRQILNLYFVAGTQDCRHLQGSPEENLLQVLETALQAGITCYQFREKGEGSLEMRHKEISHNNQRIKALAIQCRQLCHRYKAAFVMNNDVHLALEIEADGVHIGQSDMPISQAIQLCQNKLFLGVSHGNMAEITKSLPFAEHIDYFAAGPIFPTISKSDASPSTGLDFIRAIRQANIDKPLVAIGGIGGEQAQAVREAGADGIAVVSAISRAKDIQTTVKHLLKMT